MKTIADATISVHQFMAKFEMWHLYTHLFEYIRQDKKTTNPYRVDGPLHQKKSRIRAIKFHEAITNFPSKCLRLKIILRYILIGVNFNKQIGKSITRTVDDNSI
jgi:hypothetical protein